MQNRGYGIRTERAVGKLNGRNSKETRCVRVYVDEFTYQSLKVRAVASDLSLSARARLDIEEALYIDERHKARMSLNDKVMV